MHDDTTVVHLAVRVSDLASYDIAACAVSVHQQRCIDIAETTGVLVSEIELTQLRCLREKTANRVLSLIRSWVTKLSQALLEFYTHRISNGAFNQSTLQESFRIFNQKYTALETQIGHIQEESERVRSQEANAIGLGPVVCLTKVERCGPTRLEPHIILLLLLPEVLHLRKDRSIFEGL